MIVYVLMKETCCLETGISEGVKVGEVTHNQAYALQWLRGNEEGQWKGEHYWYEQRVMLGVQKV